jgi:hypothetical protein
MPELKGSRTEANLLAALQENHRPEINTIILPVRQEKRAMSR